MKKIDINKRTILEINKDLKEKKYSCKELVSEYFKKIDERNSELNVFISINKEEALNKAEDVDKKINKDISYLFGIPTA